MPALPTDLRRTLERTVIAAREAAEKGANASLNSLAVRDERLLAGLAPEQLEHRNALRVRARALGGGDNDRGFDLLAEEVAYEQWHRMLFARFLAENDLLIHPTIGVAVSLEDCAELAASEGEPDEWMTAAKYASAMLPGIFRRDDPSARVRFAANDLQALEELLDALPPVLFRSDDALGWVYQFWQTKAKQEVNASQRKVGGGDLAPVTQLFTEDYMVRFLLENSLGAWWAMRHPESRLLKEWEYLRFREDGTPAAGTFLGWPAAAREITVMDPCCGSGHFLVAAAQMLRAMRVEEEGLSAAGAAAAVLRDNLFGLELDPRCTQIAAFALVFDAWKAGLKPPASGGPPVLPHIACSGISVGGQLDQWTRLAGDDASLQMTLERLYELFSDAPDLGSLINPGDLPTRERMFLKDYADVAPLVQAALAKSGQDPAAAVFGADAEGVARAGELLARRYTLLATNPPYLSRAKQDEVLRSFADARYPLAKGDLATMFIQRCQAFVADGGAYVMVTPHSWFQLSGYAAMRREWLSQQSVRLVCLLGEEGFQSFGNRGPRAALVCAECRAPDPGEAFFAINASALPGKRQISITEKMEIFRTADIPALEQAVQLRNPDARISTSEISMHQLLSAIASAYIGFQNGDTPRFVVFFWETRGEPVWRDLQMPPPTTSPWTGLTRLIRWDGGEGALFDQALVKGREAWGKEAVLVRLMRDLSCSLYRGGLFDQSAAAIVPHNPEHLLAVWAFCSSPASNTAVRRIDQALKVTNATLVKVPFDLEYWQQEAERLYPDGLPEPHSDDPREYLLSREHHGGRGTPAGGRCASARLPLAGPAC